NEGRPPRTSGALPPHRPRGSVQAWPSPTPWPRLSQLRVGSARCSLAEEQTSCASEMATDPLPRFWDVPRVFALEVDDGWLLFDCPFNDAADDYQEDYDVYQLDRRTARQLDGRRWP